MLPSGISSGPSGDVPVSAFDLWHNCSRGSSSCWSSFLYLKYRLHIREEIGQYFSVASLLQEVCLGLRSLLKPCEQCDPHPSSHGWRAAFTTAWKTNRQAGPHSNRLVVVLDPLHDPTCSFQRVWNSVLSVGVPLQDGYQDPPAVTRLPRFGNPCSCCGPLGVLVDHSLLPRVLMSSRVDQLLSTPVALPLVLRRASPRAPLGLLAGRTRLPPCVILPPSRRMCGPWGYDREESGLLYRRIG